MYKMITRIFFAVLLAATAPYNTACAYDTACVHDDGDTYTDDYACGYTCEAATRIIQQGRVTANHVNVRSAPYIHPTNRLFQANRGRIVTIHDTAGDFLRITLGSIQNVYIHSDFVYLLPPRVVGEYSPAEEVLALALQYLGTPYVWGGNGPHSFDCSGFMVYILRPFGITIHRRSVDQATNGIPVALDALEPGDLVFFATTGTGRITHVGMYMGGGDFIHSSSWRNRGVVIDTLLTGAYARTLVSARRVL